MAAPPDPRSASPPPGRAPSRVAGDGILSPESRRRALGEMTSRTLDVLVVGGGVTGAGCALDAATRGLDVGIVEQRDWAAGTSSRSSKLIHGGLRYLEQLELGLVREALRERTLMLERLCGHLVRPVSFLYPVTRPVTERLYVGAGVAIYDAFAGLWGNPLPRHRHLGRRGALRLAPGLRPDVVRGGIRYWDAQVDDARHTMTVVRTAARWGALCASSVRVTGLLRERGRVVGVEARDLETGRTVRIRARCTVNATGVWTDRLAALAGGARLHVRASKGVHLVVPRETFASATGIITRTPSSVLFIIPWDGHWLVGTTDTEWNLDLDHPAASRADVDYLLGQANRWLRRPLTHDDIEGVYAGLRPLVAGDEALTSRLSREHAVDTSVPGMVTVAGGKYTTYRVMAVDTIDAVAGILGRRLPPSVTDRTPLLGADGFWALWNRRAALAAGCGLAPEAVERLLRRHGTAVGPVLDLIADRPELALPLPGAPAYLRAEVIHAVTHEGALHLDDVLTRRTRTSIEAPDRGRAAARVAAPLMAEALGWDEATVTRELEHYLARVDAELDSQRQPDDRTADAARMGAPDVRGAA